MNPANTDLDRVLAQGIAWTGIMKWIGQAANWAATIVVIRILTPEDYGLLGTAAIFLGFVSLLSEFGLGAAVVMLRDLSRDQVAQINGFSVLSGLAGFALSCLAAFPLGVFFESPQLPPVIIVTSLTFVISAFRTVPGSILQKDLRFKHLAAIDGLQSGLAAVALVVFALLGLRYWTLVVSGIISTAVATLLTFILQPTGFALPRAASVRRALTFSRDIIVGRVAWYVYSNADFLVARKLLGEVALGFYNVAWSLASVPIEKISALVVRVTPALFSAVQHDVAAVRRYLTVLVRGLSLFTFPLTIGLAVIADDFTLVVLGERWLPAVTPLRLLAVFAALRSVAPLLAPVLNATGEQRFNMWNSVIAALVLPLGFIVGSRWGTAGIAATWIIFQPPILFSALRRVQRRIGWTTREVWSAIWPAASTTAVMLVAVLATRAFIGGQEPTLAKLAAEIGAGGIAYGAGFFLLHRDDLRAFRSVIRLLRAPAEQPPVSVMAESDGMPGMSGSR
ncbi:MAG: lipopolysaccharide biosynthesis protein [Gemmatimonadetes bacterium]|nr:lipopolysaccharide biosynthesis protein [Gemmatimonadota bacterium]